MSKTPWAPWPWPAKGKRERKVPKQEVAVVPTSLRLPARASTGELRQLRRMARQLRKQMDDPGITPQQLLAAREAWRQVQARLAYFKGLAGG
jgi:hypothetical protein